MSTASAESSRSNAQHGFGVYIGPAARQEGKGTRVIRIDVELLSEWTCVSPTELLAYHPARSR
jgi:hypothetical protein